MKAYDKATGRKRAQLRAAIREVPGLKLGCRCCYTDESITWFHSVSTSKCRYLILPSHFIIDAPVRFGVTARVVQQATNTYKTQQGQE